MAEQNRDDRWRNNGRDDDRDRERIQPGYSDDRDERIQRDWRSAGYREDAPRGSGFYGGYEGERYMSRGQGGYYEGSSGRGRHGYDFEDEPYRGRSSGGRSRHEYAYGREDDRGGYQRDRDSERVQRDTGGAGEGNRNFGSYQTEGGQARDFAAARRGPHWGKGPRGYERSDERLTEAVCERLMDDDYLDASAISVSTAHGEVTLAGTVGDRSAKRRAEDCADSVAGVKHVQNNLRIGDGGQTLSEAAPAPRPRSRAATRERQPH